MIDRELESIIEKEKGNGDFIYPSYETFCVSNIPPTILKFFNIKTDRPELPPSIYRDVEIGSSNKVVLFLIDGFGYDQWRHYSTTFDFLNIISEKERVSPLTTVFPSTTAAALTTINTGLTPQEHALPEWFVYFNEIDMIIETLPFRPKDSKGKDTLSDVGINPQILYNGDCIYQTLSDAGIKSYSFINESIAHSAYSRLTHKGSITVPFTNISELVVRLRKLLQKENESTYFYVYIDDLDSTAHKYGPYTGEYFSKLSSLSYLLKTEFLEKTDKKTANETLLLMTADHGQININPQETMYLNKYSQLTNAFQKSRKGKTILPTGSPRDVFLHVEPEQIEEAKNFLSDIFKEKATIIETTEAVRAGLFGINKPRKEFYDRVGNLLILPHAHETIWYQYPKGKKFDLLGHHGGLNRTEMLVPFVVANLSHLL